MNIILLIKGQFVFNFLPKKLSRVFYCTELGALVLNLFI